MFVLKNITLTVHQKTLVNVDNLAFKHQAFTALIGPNGAGKTTLLNILSGDVVPTTGEVWLDNELLENYTINELAVKRSVLPQSEHIPFDIKAKAILYMGLMPYDIDHNHPRAIDLLNKISETLELEPLLERSYQRLSGGEKHQLQIGRVLMQTLFSLTEKENYMDRVMLLDEPFNHLDLYYQQKLLRYFKSLTEQGLTIICVMHDINHALHISDELVLLKSGMFQGKYSPQELWQSNDLQTLFEVDFIRLSHPNNPEISTLSFNI